MARVAVSHSRSITTEVTHHIFSTWWQYWAADHSVSSLSLCTWKGSPSPEISSNLINSALLAFFRLSEVRTDPYKLCFHLPPYMAPSLITLHTLLDNNIHTVCQGYKEGKTHHRGCSVLHTASLQFICLELLMVRYQHITPSKHNALPPHTLT